MAYDLPQAACGQVCSESGARRVLRATSRRRLVIVVDTGQLLYPSPIISVASGRTASTGEPVYGDMVHVGSCTSTGLSLLNCPNADRIR